LSPSVWAELAINFCYVISARVKTMFRFDLTPYLRDPIDAWDFEGSIREVTVCAPEQTGKTLAWLIGLLWTFIFKPCMSLVCYESDEKAAEINSDKFLPLMRAIPELAAELLMPKSVRSDRYKFSNVTSYFQGSGNRITSKSSMANVADELDDWQEHSGEVDNLDDMRKRARSFDESILYKVCTVKGSDKDLTIGIKKSKIWAEFKKSSMGFWHLCCLNPECPSQNRAEHRGLTMRSADVHNMQFQTDKEEKLIPGTCRLVCPECGHVHVEAQKGEMNRRGGYIHRFPERLKGPRPHYGFQWGALASQWESLCWDFIAESQLKAGHSGNIKDQIFFDNSIRGLPFKMRKINSKQTVAIRSHCAAAPPDPDTIEAVFLIVDTQEHVWKWEVRALDVNSSRWQLAYGVCDYLDLDDDRRAEINEIRAAAAQEEGREFIPVSTIKDVMEAEYLGIQPLLGVVDEGGHHKREVAAFVAAMNEESSRLYCYKGDNRGAEDIRFSDNQEFLLLCHERKFKADFLYYIYIQDKKDNYYWHLLPTEYVSDEYVLEIAAMQPDPTNKAEGHLFENYAHHQRVHDYFDTGKMYLALEEMAIQFLEPSCWRQGKAEILNLAKKSGDDKPEEKPATKSDSGSWMSGYSNR